MPSLARAAIAAAPDTAREEVLARYRRLRSVSRALNSRLLEHLPTADLLRAGRRIGLVEGGAFLTDREDELGFAFDLALHCATRGAPRPIDRFARQARPTLGPEEARVLDAMVQSRFALIQVERRHDIAGLVVLDLISGQDLWLMDEGLEASAEPGWALATRLFAVEDFVITAGVLAPFEPGMIEDICERSPALGVKTLHAAVQDRRFAEAIYETVLATGLSEIVQYAAAPPAA